MKEMEFGSKKNVTILFHYLKGDEATLTVVENNVDLPNSCFPHSPLSKKEELKTPKGRVKN